MQQSSNVDETGAASRPTSTRGKMVLLVNTEFSGSTQFNSYDRAYGKLDKINITNSFSTNFGFDLLNKDTENVSIDKWDHSKAGDADASFKPILNCNCLRCLITTADYSDTDYFLFAVSSHGKENEGQEILLSDDKRLKLSDILEVLSDKKCPSLKGKTRIVLLQCCRTPDSPGPDDEPDDDGNVLLNQHGPTDENDTNDDETHDDMDRGPEPNVHDQPEDDGSDEEEEEEVTACVPDSKLLGKNFLLVNAVVKGKKAKASSTDGAWMFQAIDEVISKVIVAQNPVDFLKMLTKVASRVAEMEGKVFLRNAEGKFQRGKDGKKSIDEKKSGKKNAICITHRLTRPVIFYPKIDTELDKDIPKPSLF